MKNANQTKSKPATPSYFKSNEEVALLLMTARKRNALTDVVLARVEARIATQQTIGYKPGRNG
jgi:hypothetical protein